MNHFLSIREIRAISEMVLTLDQVSLGTNQASVSLSVPTNLGNYGRLPGRWRGRSFARSTSGRDEEARSLLLLASLSPCSEQILGIPSFLQCLFSAPG